MREQLQKLIDKYLKREDDGGYSRIVSAQSVADELESILAANPEPVVRLRPGWVAKDSDGLWWLEHKPVWYGESWGAQNCMSATDWCDGESIVDPWPNHPNGGPDCWREVR